ncbi:MAG: phosphodiester glycosidase family protein, partial [bacterium]|nr:phosphodiester glycosidase family protein [bacterium]
TYVYFVVVDGRTTESIGMSYTELGNFCKDTLGAEFAVVEDGGGSSTLWVNGMGVVNYPSDGSERYVANGLMMVNVLPMSKTLTYTTGAFVVTTTNTNIRLGPGTNYAVITTLPKWTQGTILSHSLNGVLATGKNWWKCQFGSIEGWIEEGLMYLIPVELIDFETEVETEVK